MGRGVRTKPNLTSRVWAKTWGPLLVLVLGLAVAVEQQKKHQLPLVNNWSCCSLLLASSTQFCKGSGWLRLLYQS